MMNRRIGMTLAVAAALAASTSAQNPSNWEHVGQDPGASKYSSLAQINTGNVKSLQQAWTFHTGDKSGFFESTPLVVDGTMYITAQNGVFALDASTGTQLWKFESDGGTRRGLAYWPGDAASTARIYGSAQERLVALDAKTGKLVPQFGQGGFIDLGTTMATPASVYKDVLITPGTSPEIRAWNARTGALIWKFDLVAQPGDPNNKTWEGDSWKAVGGTNTWGYLTVDTERGIVYVPVSIAGENDYVGVTRPGDNLYGTSLVALDIATGKRLWHQQLVHHDIWDNDLGAHPTLIDVTRDGKSVPAVAQITKMGLLFIFNRVTGAPIFGMEERAVPQSTVPGEKTSPTQPFPLLPPPLARNSIKKSELPTNISPEHTAYCLGLWDKYGVQDSVPYTPWQLGQDVVVFPGAIGGGNWGGVAYNKTLNLVVTNVMNAGQWGHLEKSDGAPLGGDQPGAGGGRPTTPARDALSNVEGRGGRGGAGGGPPRSREPYRKVTPEGGRFWDPKTQYSCAPTPWGELIAVNTNTGGIAWRVPLGSFDELEKKGIKAGRPSLGGAITTAGDLVFIAATTDGYFRAFDARNGAELWSTKLSVPGHAIPSTYLGKDGKQYVAITVGGGGFLRSPLSDEVVAFRLP
jgi:glucose dehydrogenase